VKNFVVTFHVSLFTESNRITERIPIAIGTTHLFNIAQNDERSVATKA